MRGGRKKGGNLQGRGEGTEGGPIWPQRCFASQAEHSGWDQGEEGREDERRRMGWSNLGAPLAHRFFSSSPLPFVNSIKESPRGERGETRRIATSSSPHISQRFHAFIRTAEGKGGKEKKKRLMKKRGKRNQAARHASNVLFSFPTSSKPQNGKEKEKKRGGRKKGRKKEENVSFASCSSDIFCSAYTFILCQLSSSCEGERKRKKGREKKGTQAIQPPVNPNGFHLFVRGRKKKSRKSRCAIS